MRALLAVTDVRVRINAHIWRVVTDVCARSANGIDTRAISDSVSFDAEGIKSPRDHAHVPRQHEEDAYASRLRAAKRFHVQRTSKSSRSKLIMCHVFVAEFFLTVNTSWDIIANNFFIASDVFNSTKSQQHSERLEQSGSETERQRWLFGARFKIFISPRRCNSYRCRRCFTRETRSARCTRIARRSSPRLDARVSVRGVGAGTFPTSTRVGRARKFLSTRMQPGIARTCHK